VNDVYIGKFWVAHQKSSLNNSVTKESKRAIGENDTLVQLAKLSPKNAIRFVDILQHAMPMS